MTFASNPGAAPAYGAVSLPSVSLPDSSVAVLGIYGTGANDNIVTKTFGSAPNRQEWVFFSSYSDASGNWTYWAIVLEETSNSIYVVDMRHSTAAAVNLSIGVQISSTVAVSVSGSPAVSTLAGGDPTSADNYYYEFIQGTQPSLDLTVKSSDLGAYLALTNAPFNISGEVTNLGTATVNTFDLNYQVNGGNVVTTTITPSTGVASFSDEAFAAATAWTPSASGSYELKIWASNINGAVDQNPGNDTLVQNLSVLLFETNRQVVIEEGTGTWCGWCPRGAVAMEYMSNTYDGDFIGIAVHNGDPMTVTAYDNGANISSFPGMNVDRTLLGVSVSNASMEGYYLERKAVLPPADITITNNTLHSYSGEATVDVEVHFAADVTGDYKLALVVVEDGVSGSGSGYAQANYYSGGGNGNLSGAGLDWHLEPDPVPASDVIYDHVGRKLVGGYNGVSGIIPTTINENDKFTHTFTTNISSDVNDLTEVSFVVLLIGPNNEIVNGDKEHAAMILGVEEAKSFGLTTYPNPSNGLVNLRLESQNAGQVSLEVTNLMGQIVHANTNQLGTGTYTQSVDLSDLPKGVYNIRVTMNGESQTERILLQ